jgi:hypothetical protein
MDRERILLYGMDRLQCCLCLQRQEQAVMVRLEEMEMLTFKEQMAKMGFLDVLFHFFQEV